MRFCWLACLLCSIVACSVNNYNPTAFDFEYHEPSAAAIKTILVVPDNLGRPSRAYLQEHEAAIDRQLKQYLEKNGYKTAPEKIYQSLWRKTSARYGDMYDPSTGRMTGGYQKSIAETLEKLFASNPGIDAVLFTNLIEQEVTYGNATKKIAIWDGVRRKLKTQGVGNAVSADFDWAETVDGITLETWLFNRKQELVLHNMGGIEIAQALEIHNNQGEFRRRDDLLEDEDDIAEAIRIAMHPFIWMEHFPHKDPER